MVRLVRTPAGVAIDTTGKLAGRGAYLHPTRTCWQVVLKGNRIEQALRTRLSAEDRSRLLEYMQSLPETEADDGSPSGAENRADAA
jgi:predicted RNA-binding protein YlxR (DUF448 family)